MQTSPSIEPVFSTCPTPSMIVGALLSDALYPKPERIKVYLVHLYRNHKDPNHPGWVKMVLDNGSEWFISKAYGIPKVCF